MNADKLIKLGIDLRNKWSGEVKTTCPKCAHQRKKKNDPSLGVNIDTGVWKCHHCGWSGSVNQYVRPEARPEVAQPKIFEYFENRKITPNTVKHFRISESTEWMPQDQKEHKVICFNYFLDGELLNIKFKTSDKKFKMVKDAKKIPYNIDAIKNSPYLIVCEGEEETMVWHQSNLVAISVPNGASPKKSLNKTEGLASEDDLFSLHRLVATKLIDQLNRDDVKASDLANAIKFLKDQGITARSPESGSPINMRQSIGILIV